MLEANRVLDRAKLRAGVISKEALRQLEQAKAEGETILAWSRDEGLRQAAKEVEQAKRDAIEDAVEWLVQEQQLERHIVVRLEKEIRALAAQAFAELVGGLDAGELLLQQLGKYVSDSINEGKLELRVNPVHWARAIDTFAAEPRILVIPDKSLTIKQAILNSAYVQIQLDLDRHLQLLVDRLKQPNREVEMYEQN
ncbi:hypothetical protein [Chitinimonas arctica]|nr:hypothetical protein [Chitinimonas arctica]